MEIGSEFWLEEVPTKEYKLDNNTKKKLFLSGRTAIDYALRIIEKEKKIKRVYFPSYCCESMIEPFSKKNIEVQFYTVSFRDGNFIFDIDCNKDCDIFFAMNYFGFSSYNMDYYIENFKKRNICIIEDATHSIFSKRKYNKNSDLIVASLRKWMPIISGGILINQSQRFNDIQIKLKNNERYVNLKEIAMTEKYNYIKMNKKIKKEQFLEKFSKSNEMLDIDYENYSMDQKSYNILRNININEIIEKRKNNSKVIYDFLIKQKEMQYLKKIDLQNDCPIFIPIFLENGKRNRLKEYLIKHKIYCPNHWPIPKYIEKKQENEIYNMELSLICDQRYDEKNIKEYIDLIKRYKDE